jgi:hypothetical protein
MEAEIGARGACHPPDSSKYEFKIEFEFEFEFLNKEKSSNRAVVSLNE